MHLRPRQHRGSTSYPLASLVTLVVVLSCPNAGATPPALKNAPSRGVEAGNTLMEAWLVFRKDLDTISHGQIHPQLLDNLLAQAPAFLVRDAARLANSPGVVAAATRRLSRDKTPAGKQLLARLHGDHVEGEMGLVLWSRRIEAGDQEARDRALAGLGNSNPLVRLKAARVLAAAGDSRGIRELRNTLREEPRLADRAASALGEYGSRTDEKALSRALASGADRRVFTAAIGHLRLRRTFPVHHTAIIRRDPAGLRFSGSKSLYTAWFDAVYQATEAGATSSTELLKALEKVRHDSPRGDGGEVTRRQLKALIGFWRDVDLIIENTDGSPRWPASYEEALSWLRWNTHKKTRPIDLARRVTAAVALCSWASRKVSHEKMFRPGRDLTVITPGGDLISDRNLATSWRGTRGGTVVLDLIEPAKTSSVRFAQSCGDEDAARVGVVTISGSGSGKEWSVTKKLDPESRYFQRVELPRKYTRRLEIELVELEGKGPACIGELRVE